MSNKTIKKYVNGEWVTLINPEVTVIQEIESGKVSDTNVVITNYNYTDDGEETTLDDTLTVISNDISKLQRNVSWLAEHGGGGGSGSGGTFNPYGFEIETPQVENGGNIFLKKEEMANITVKFRITGGYDGDICRYQYIYDGGQPSALKDLEINKYETIVFDNSESTSKSHFLKISGLNPYGTNISPFSFNIYLSNLSIKFAGELSSDIFYISQNDTVGELPLVIENGIIGSETVVSGTSTDGRPTYYPPFTNKTTDPQRIALKFWDMVERSQTEPNKDYIVTFSAFAKLGATELTDTTAPLRVRVINPSELTVVVGAEGSGGESQIEVQQNALLNYNFNVFAPSNLGRYVYYSVIIEKSDGQKELILGEYYDENTHKDGATIQSNPTIGINTIKTETYRLSESLYEVGDIVNLRVKVFASSDISVTSIASKEIKIIAESRSFWKRQYYNRIGSYNNPDTLFACWDKNNIIATSKFKWNSNISNYTPISYTTQTPIEISVDILNANNASGAQTSDGTPYFRIQNHAYGKVDFSNYASELQAFFTNRQTFTISITLVDNNQTGTDHTLFLWGNNNQDGELTGNGFRIDTDKIYWAYKEDIGGQITQKSLTCNIPRGQKTTIDFVYEGDKLKVYKNGILNILKRINKIDISDILPNVAYFGVNRDSSQNFYNFADMDVYEFAIYTKSINDIQIAINGKNARIEGSDDASITEYNNWLIRNFISSPDTGDVPESEFFKGDGFNEYFSIDSLTNIKAVNKIPTIVLNFGVDSEFTEDFFYNSYTSGDVTKQFQTCTGTYYDPNKKTDIPLNLKAALQGTSTLMYRVKNIELMMDEYVEIDGVVVPVLFQPKNIWLPEKQFTLKADVVDSAHANNAVIGEWINTNASKINLVDNPAMEQFAQEENKPLYVDLNGTPVPHFSTKQQKNITYHEDVTIKHTLEGFPVLLFIKFKDVSPEHASTPYKFIGIYSFNLGRYSYYNMGMKFLESFSRLDSNGNDEGCPSVIRYYKEKSTLGTINVNDIYSFEFDNDANENNHDLPMWSQSNSSITHSLGEFKYPENVSESDPIWNGGLKNLFDQTSKWYINGYYNDGPPTYINAHGETQNIFDPIYPYHVEGSGSDKRYVKDSDNPITQDNNGYEYLSEALNISTAARYFMIANAFGMTDSLGKNMTIRSWNGGRTWYTCFYDMDTALGLANDGSESILATASIDKLKTVVDTQTQTTKLQTTYHDDSSQYAQHISKLWGILRDRQLLYNMGQTVPLYENIWQTMRSGNGALSSSDKFVNVMRDRVETCGELIFDCDYNSKYVQQGQVAGSDASQFLHGTRIDYVKDWLKRHFYYLDGLFDVTRYGLTGTYEDSPYYGEEFMASVNYPLTYRRLAFNVRSTTPSFLKISVGSAEPAKFFIEKENTDMTAYVANSTSPNSQIAIKGSSLLSKLDGLQNAFQDIRTQNQKGAVKSLNEFNISNSNMLNVDPVLTTSVFFNENNSSALETLNLSRTTLIDSAAAYEVNLINFNKLLNVDISDSDVKTLVLPNTVLETLRITNSKITTFTLNDQPKISDISFDGCDKLQSIFINNCSAISSLTIIDKLNLETVKISNCKNLSEITISNCHSLYSIEIVNNISLKKILINNCENSGLDIKVYGSSLEDIVISGVSETNKIITLPEKEKLTGVTIFKLSNCYKIGGIQYFGTPIEQYNGENVFDFSLFNELSPENFVLRNLYSMKYARVANDDGTAPALPFKLYRNTFYSCSSLTRVFGYIEICDGEVFNGFKDFYINHEGYDPGDGTSIPPFVYSYEDDYYTNVKIGTAELTRCFAETNCDISDAYYIFQLCNENTLSLEGAFSNCQSIVTTIDEPLNENAFSKCVNVNNIDKLFNGGCSINGELSFNLLSPLINNLTTFDDVFSGEYTVKTTKCFFPVGSKIKSIVSFNPKGTDDADHRDIYLLTNLTELVEIVNSFNECSIDFSTGGFADATELFKYNTKLVKIDNSFRKIVGYGSLGNIFGGESNDLNYYPRSLSSVTASFTFSDGDHEGVAELYEGDDFYGVLFPIGNSLLKSISTSIVYITGNYPGENRSYGSFDERSNNHPSFCGRGILKYIDNFDYNLMDGRRHADDCNGENFPYELLNGCTNLKEFPSIFEEVHNFKNNGGDIETINITLPRNIFSYSTKIENISKSFYNMYENILCEFSAYGFRNNAIVNADFLFGKTATERFKTTGEIPYGLFYQSTVKNYQPNIGLTEQQANALNISDDSGELVEPVENLTEFNGTYITINPTIKVMRDALKGINSSSMTPYHASINSWEDLVEDNPEYNPIKYFVSGTHYQKNTLYNPYKKIWNKYVFDNSTDFNDYIENTDIEHVVDEYGNPIVNMAEMPQEFTDGFTPSPQTNRIADCVGNEGGYSRIEQIDIYRFFAVTNYMFAPDIFRYCVNATTTDVSGVFSDSSGEFKKEEYEEGYIEGLRGTLPEFVFEPINRIQTLRSIFESCRSIFPYRWGSVVEGQEIDGSTYPPKLFDNMPNLYDISKMFSGGRIWGKTVIPEGLFGGCHNTLKNVSYLWRGAIWIDTSTTRSQLNVLTFNLCSNITNISYMLGDSQRNCIKLITELFKPLYNPILEDCSYFLFNATATTGSVPPFWEWSSYQLNSYKFALKGVPRDANVITNYTPENFDKFIRNE